MAYKKIQAGDNDKAVEAAKRGVAAFYKEKMPPPVVSRFFGPFFLTKVKRFQKDNGVSQSGVIGPITWGKLEPYLDSRAKDLLTPSVVKLVEPKQGFSSLDKSLWQAYSIGRNMGLTDLGTYNPASTLPGGGPSDHSVFPAFAFDLGFSPQTGYGNFTARKFFLAMVGRKEVEYVILGNKIWSKSRGLHDYTAGNHDNHVHVSGVR
jgi:hypothetical protein